MLPLPVHACVVSSSWLERDSSQTLSNAIIRCHQRLVGPVGVWWGWKFEDRKPVYRTGRSDRCTVPSRLPRAHVEPQLGGSEVDWRSKPGRPCVCPRKRGTRIDDQTWSTIPQIGAPGVESQPCVFLSGNPHRTMLWGLYWLVPSKIEATFDALSLAHFCDLQAFRKRALAGLPAQLFQTKRCDVHGVTVHTEATNR